MITLLLLVRATYMYGVVLHAHPIRGEPHNQRNTTGEVATLRCNNMLEAGCLRHNKNSQLLKAAGCAWSWCCPIGSVRKKANNFLMKKL